MADSALRYSVFENTLNQAGSDLDETSIQKLQNLNEYLDVESDYDNNLFDSSSYYNALLDKNKEYKQSKEDENLYGFIPGDWLPDWVKAGYNQSITGLAEQIATGSERFDLSDYNPNILEDIGATVISFLQPADIGTMIATGGVGGIAAKSATKSAIRKAIQQGVGKGVPVSDDLVRSVLGEKIILSTGKLASSGKVKGGFPLRVTTTPLKEAKKRLTLNGLSGKKADEIIEKATPKVLNQAFNASVVGGTQLGFYSGLQSSLGQIADPTQEFDYLMNIKTASKGAVLGSATGFTGPLVKTALKGLSPTTQTLASKAVEVGSFGTIAPVLEGELPTPEDYAHAAGVIGALGAQRYATGKLVKGYKKITKAKQDMALNADQAAKIFGQIDTESVIQPSEVFVSRKGVKIRDVRFDTRSSKKQTKTTGIGTETTTLKEDIVKYKKYNTKTKAFEEGKPIKFSTFQREGFTRGGAGTKSELAKRRINGIYKISQNLKVDNNRFRDIASSEYVVGTTGGNRFKGMNSKKIIQSMSPVEQIKMYNRMMHESRVAKLSERLKNNGWESTMIPNKTLSDYLGFKLLDRSEKRFQTPIYQEVRQRVNNFDSRYYTLMGSANNMFVNSGLYSGGFPKVTQYLSKKARTKAEQEAIQLGRDLENPNINLKTNPKVKELRDILEYMWDVANKAGVDLGPKEQFYFPRIIKQDILKKLADDLGKLKFNHPQLFIENSNLNKKQVQSFLGKEILAKGKLSNETVNILYDMAGIKRNAKRNEVPDFDLKIGQAFKRLNTTVKSQFYNIAQNLETARKAKDLPDYMMERDARIVFSKYTHQWARRIASVESFGRYGEFWKRSIEGFNDLAQNKAGKFTDKQVRTFRNERDTLDKLYKIQSGNIELDPTYNWKSAKARKAWSDIVDFEIATKIGLGFATVPNITQIAISTAVKTGYYPVIRGGLKLATSKAYRDEIRKAGVSNLSLYQSYFGLNPSDSFMGKIADGATRLSGFQKINQLNQLISAAAAREWIGLLQPIAQGKGTGRFALRQNWARQNLRDLGISDINKITQRQTSEAMFRFARDTQLQRNILQEPLVFNDPRFRPLFLFKKFGYKQFNWIRGQLGNELKRGNVFPMLRLASAGLFGGEFVSLARDKLAEVYAGREIYTENEPFLNFGNLKDVALGDKPIDSLVKVDRMTFADVLDRFASVGAFGVVMDVVAAENKIRALEFVGKPAVVQDFDKIWTAMTSTWVNIGEYGGLGAVQRIPRYIGPALGSIPRRALERFETEGQRKSYVKYRKGLTRSKILDSIIEGNSIRATRLIANWNRAFPENPILYDDVDVDSITERIINKAKKRAMP